MTEEKISKENTGKVYTPQKGLQEFIVKSDVDIMFCGGSMSSGKALSINELVCTPYGFRRMGDIQKGDTITGSDGRPQKVIATYDRGIMDNIELQFSDGRTVQCSRDHLWTVREGWREPKRYKNNNKDPKKLWRVCTTQDIIDFIDKDVKANHYLRTPSCGEVRFTQADYKKRCPIDPYLLGVLLGDGCLSEKLDYPTFTVPDKEIIEELRIRNINLRLYDTRENLFVGCVYDKKLVDDLKRKDLWGKLADSKSIPKSYLLAPVDMRKELLRGLLDTDGTVQTNSNISYCSVSEQLANDVAFLVRSLGGKATVTTRQGKYKKGEEWVECKIAYNVYIRLRNGEDYFYVKRKGCRCRESSIEETLYEGQIVGYKVLGQEHMKCIAVSNPDGLFLTRDFIVTHNTFGMILSLAEPIQDPNFRAVFLRRNLAETKTGGGMFDDCKKVYADYIKSAKESDNPRITFNSGAFVEFTHISDETPEKLLERIRGWQFSLILLDEGTSFEWSTFRLLMSRNRSTAKWTNKIRLTCNPKKRHWLRTFLKDYIGPDGFIRPDWDGRVRYLYIKGKNVEDVVWGDTKEEVYAQCKYQIDEAVKKFNEKGGNVDYRSMIKSFTFYLGSPAENKAMIGTNASYLGSVAAMGEAEARANLLGNWNVDLDEDEEAPLKRADIESVFDVDPQRNNDRWITMDLADTGADNTLILVWDGFHVIDYKILMKSTPKQNAECVEMMAAKHNIGDSHIIYDGIRAAYMLDYIPDAVAYISYRAPLGKYGRMAENLKTECYLRLVEMIKRGRISFDDQVAMSVYQHQNIGVPILFRTEFSEECSVIRFIDLPSGRKRIANKKDMNRMLGKGRSMDLCDPIAMRMMPVLGYEYGTELESTFCEDENPDEISDTSVDIYDEATWS